MLQEILNLRESKLGPTHPDTLGTRNSLGLAYKAASQTAKAIQIFKENLKTQEDTLGPDHPDTLASRNNLADTYHDNRQLAETIRLHEENLKLSQAKLGARHHHTLVERNNLATAYFDAGRPAQGIRLLVETLEIQETTLGEDHPETLKTMINLGRVYRRTERLMDAVSLLEKTLERCRKRVDGFPAELGWLPGALAETCEIAGQFAKAEAIYRDLAVRAREQFGPDDPHTAGPMAGIGSNLLRQHKYSDAEPLLRDCLKVFAAKLPDSLATSVVRSLLGEAFLGQKKYAEAEPLLRQGYEGMKALEATIPPQGKIRLTEALERLVRLYEATGKKDEAAKYRKLLEERNAAQKKSKS
jgi:tetratricopeptide (TPR) repeat protein